MKIVDFKKWKCTLKFDQYANNGRIAITLVNAFDMEEDDIIWSPGTITIATATVNIQHYPLEEGNVVIKTYSENEGMYQALYDAGIISAPSRWMSSGYVNAPVCKLLIDPEEYMQEKIVVNKDMREK